MKALILNASPRRGGLVTAMTSRIASALTDHGWETVTIDVSDCRIAPCRGCMACRSTGRCTLPDDDAQHILSLMRETDALIVGAPCYWGNMPGTLKLLFDRMVYGMMTTDRRGIPHGLLKGKRSAVVTASTTPWPWNRLFRQTSGTVRAIHEVIRTAGYRSAGTIQAAGTRHLNGNPPSALLHRCDRIALRLSRG